MAATTTTSRASRSSAFTGLGRIDVHHHCFPNEVPDLAPEFARCTATFGVGFTGSFPGTPEDHLKYMDEVGIQTAVVVSGHPFDESWKDYHLTPK